MRHSNVMVCFLFFATITGLLTGCADKSVYYGKKNIDSEGAQTSGAPEQGGFAHNTIYSTKHLLKAPYNQSYYFALNKYDLTSYDIESISIQANYLITHPQAKVRLEGNTDIRGSREYNIALGWKRAKAVAETLKKEGVNEDQVAIVSYGKEKPLVLGEDEGAHSQNRRVDMIYETK